MFDDEELIEDTRVDINQTNNAQSASAVDSNRIEVTRVAGVANQDPHAIDAIESSRTCFANEIKRNRRGPSKHAKVAKLMDKITTRSQYATPKLQKR